MMKNIGKLMVALTLVLNTSWAYAALPVIDTASIARLVQQIDEMKKQYEMLKKQYDQAVQIKENLQGNYGMGLLENGVEAAQGRRHLPKTWQEVVDMQKSGDLPGLFAGKKDFYKDLLPSIDTKMISKDPKDRSAVGYKLSTDNTRAAFASVESIYDNIENRIKTVENLTSEIEKTQNAKQAIDLNSRIVAESNFINLEMSRLNSMQVALQASLQNIQNQATATHAEFFGQSKNGKPPNFGLKGK